MVGTSYTHSYTQGGLCTAVRLRFILDTVAPVAARHFSARFRYLGDTGSGTYLTLPLA